MKEKKVKVKSDAGVHARPASILVREAMKFPCDIYIIKGQMEANGKSIMSVLGLAITKGSSLIIRANGEMEEEAVDRISALIENDFAELASK
jgi:phosphocarrier protein